MKKLLFILASVTLFTFLLASCDSGTTNPTPVEATTTAAPETVKEPEIQATIEEKAAQASQNNIQDSTKADKPPVSAENETDVKISKDDAKKAVLAHAGLTESDIKFYKSELDRERGIVVYEIEFDSGNYEYDYEVNAENGKVIKSEKELRD